ASGPAKTASCVLQPRLCFCWRADILRFRSYRPVPKRSGLCRSHPQGREASQSAGAGADQVRTGNQSKDSESARPLRTALAARPCRRGDRIAVMSAFGGKADMAIALQMSAYDPKRTSRHTSLPATLQSAMLEHPGVILTLEG